ncbi:Protein N-acetyltransferase, RimJ/RimL family [Austwickia chelonae]|uniref:Putative acetyltransferase n=1 Tax=Austwickia chelonae NBRC 105200 TaxID=1184607 RepID=K6UN31_9MICO|nr:GNAT family N-acetyltransferase [Austwickia chelonae]GAB78641.1 putative acetyltransferase [Austwickia chelonae NBRC 105200]SEW34307.1 Protein N-acetyltransferase, RimJ/RimL family [Austwickia chelonae]
MKAQRKFDALDLRDGEKRLRALDEDDVEAVHRACQDPEMHRWLTRLPDPYTLEHAHDYVHEFSRELEKSGAGIALAIEHEGQFAGTIALAETDWENSQTKIGYWVVPWRRGHGLAAWASSVLGTWALLDQGIERVVLRAATGNLASQRAAEKAGYIAEGIERSSVATPGGRGDMKVYSLIRSDLEN